MRLLILSDLHREVWYRAQSWYEGKADPFPVIDLAMSRPDLVLLAGDIDSGHRAIAWASEYFAGVPVLYVSGNHEAYGAQIDQVEDDLCVAAAVSGHVHYMQRREVLIGGVRFLGATLWSDFLLYGIEHARAATEKAVRRMNDYRRIHVEAGRALTPEDTRRWHAADVAWLESRLRRPFDGPTVVITHMAPSARSISAPYRDELLSAAFASNLDHLVEQADLWVHGHTHASADYRIGRARVVCNPLGYPTGPDLAQPENPHFDPNCIIEV